jgi:hypothetical protein
MNIMLLFSTQNNPQNNSFPSSS